MSVVKHGNMILNFLFFCHAALKGVIPNTLRFVRFALHTHAQIKSRLKPTPQLTSLLNRAMSVVVTHG